MSTLASQNGTKDFAFLSIIMGRIQKGRDLPSVKKFAKKRGFYLCGYLDSDIAQIFNLSDSVRKILLTGRHCTAHF